MQTPDLRQRVWWGFLDPDVKELIDEAVLLLMVAPQLPEKFHDYSFIVFPAAKAYEGFLKKVFLERGFITKEDYIGKRFRVGKALNPSLDVKYREKESVYDRLADYCGGRELADEAWETWRLCRNQLFHWFPNEKNAVSYAEARERVNMIFNTMDKLCGGCNIK
jgi:hypothetical protein